MQLIINATLFDLLQVVVMIAVCVAFLLSLLLFWFWNKNRNLEYKYMKLIAKSNSKVILRYLFISLENRLTFFCLLNSSYYYDKEMMFIHTSFCRLRSSKIIKYWFPFP